MSNNYLISDAAKQVKVEAHVLRYWEEELGLPIKRNELGHRYYTAEDVEQFKEIKDLKERGLQLKAIRMILKNGKLDMLAPGTAAAARKLQEDKPASQTTAGQVSEKNAAQQKTASGQVKDGQAAKQQKKGQQEETISRQEDSARETKTAEKEGNNRNEHNVTEQNKSGYNKEEHNKTQDNKAEHNKTEHNKIERNKTEYNKAERSETEHNEAEQNTTENRGEQQEAANTPEIQEHTIITGAEAEHLYNPESREQKAQRLQWLLQQLFRETLQENNKELCQIMKENILKEMDYQFRVQEEREDERHTQRIKQEEEHFKKIDELLRKKRRLLKK